MDNRARMQDSLDYIEENLKADITAEELARRAGFSLVHYYRLFQAAVGLPVGQYILRRRLLHAVYEMRGGRTGIDAALAYGFDTYAGFYRAFRREYGCTPSEFLVASRARRPCRIVLTEEEHIMVTKKKAAQVLVRWGLEHEPLTDIYYEGTGRKSDSAFYVGQHHVLKFTANPGKVKNHLALSGAIAEAGLWAAAPVPTLDGEETVRNGELIFYLSSRLSGRCMTAEELYREDGLEKARQMGEAIGRLHLALSGMEVPVDDADLCGAAERALPRVKELLQLEESLCQEFLDVFPALYPKLPRQVIHRDPNPGNIIQSGDRWGFIDFELSERNVRLFDPCYAATAILSETFGKNDAVPEQWLDICQNLLHGYDRIAKLSDAERQAVPYLLLANQLICTAWFAGQQRYADIFEVNRQMTRWLAGRFDRLKDMGRP